MTPEQTYTINLPLINKLIEACSEYIKNLTGLDIDIVHIPVRDTPKTQDDSIRDFINECCRCWGTVPEYILKSRMRIRVDMRQLITYAIKKKYPRLTHARTGSFLNQDHTTVIATLKTIQARFAAKDELVMNLYQKIKHVLPDEKVQG